MSYRMTCKTCKRPTPVCVAVVRIKGKDVAKHVCAICRRAFK